jgi:hypothetical protein
MVVYTYHGKSAYIDDRLARELENEVIPDIMEKDSDNVFCIDGGEGSGKSKFSDTLCGFVASKVLEIYKVDMNYDVDCVHLSPHDFRNAIIKAKKNSIVVYDEAHKGMGSRRSLSEINGILNDLMMEMRQKNLFVVLILPTFFMLDKYPAIFRTIGLFHVYRKKNPVSKKNERGYWVYFNRKYKLELYIKGKQYFNYNCVQWTNFRGRFLNQWIMDEKLYRKKKAESFKQSGKRETKSEVYLNQRNLAIYALSKQLDMGFVTVARVLRDNGLKFSERTIQKILDEAKSKINSKNIETEEEKDDSDEE